jgi:uncharacterized protein (TIGR02453 family)
MTGRPYFDAALFRFLRQLETKNNRQWFQENKNRYERDVRDPMLRFISDFGPRLGRISRHFVADPRTSGGSMFRIYRDTRFSKDKSPYKTGAAAQFRHQDGKDVHAPGFYLHLEPGNVFAGFGLWHPASPTLSKVRDAIVDDPARWKRILSSAAFKSHCRLTGEMLKRPPQGYDPEHPLMEDLKRKDFVAVTPFSERQACSADFLDRFTKACRTASGFVGFLTRAVGLLF